MRFLIDECISPTTTRLLRSLGHDVLDIKELRQFGSQDPEIYRIACQQKRAIFTTDKGFRVFNPAHCGGDHHFYGPAQYTPAIRTSP